MGKKQKQASKYKNSNLKKIMEFMVLTLTLILLMIFPLYYHNYYYDILNVKYRFYWVVVLVFGMFVVLSKIILYSLKQFEQEGNLIKDKFYKEKGIKEILGSPDCAILVFLSIAIISTIFSEYPVEAFRGNQGRFTGLALLIVYTICFFMITKILKFKTWILDLCLFAGILACIFGITDYFYLDLLHFKENINPLQYDSFTSTFGNINTYTAYVAMIMGLAATLFATAKKTSYKTWYFICMIISFFAIIMGISDNAYLALAGLFAFLPLYLFRYRSGIRNYFVIIASFFTVIQCIDWINQSYQGKLAPLDGLFQVIVGYSGLAYIVILLWLVVGFLYWLAFKQKDQSDVLSNRLRMVWLGLLIVAILVISYILYDANIAGNPQRYGSLSYYLVFNDEWGTHRWYIWRIGIENYLKFTPFQKLFGYGPDTFGIITVNHNYYEMTRRYNEIFDSAHNEYLQYFITIGPLGLAAYLWLVISSGIKMVKRGVDSPAIMAILFALICYSVQALVNINLPIATPIMWTLLMVGLAACRQD